MVRQITVGIIIIVILRQVTVVDYNCNKLVITI